LETRQIRCFVRGGDSSTGRVAGRGAFGGRKARRTRQVGRLANLERDGATGGTVARKGVPRVLRHASFEFTGFRVAGGINIYLLTNDF
jgi:hypothetical protein